MGDPIIIAEGVGKKFTLNHQQAGQRYTALRDVIVDRVRKGIAGVKNIAVTKEQNRLEFLEKEDFWALKDISFTINRGDRVGIIGRNGAGKSTLLKVLSRIVEPTCGRISIRGRVASLLEVGTGFHPELTGRENIFLNGAILGMSRVEIKHKFDEIVAFAEVEKFLDTPVKRYSSGMYVRLAFSVAAHLEPEILIVDEVLAVGDAQFQKKCLGKMEDVSANQGRTVLFVSHQMEAINSLTQKCILLKHGELVAYDQTEISLRKYLYEEANDFTYKEPTQPTCDCISCIKIINGNNSNIVYVGEKLEIEFEVFTQRSIGKLHFSFQIFSSQGKAVLHMFPNQFELGWVRASMPNYYTFKCIIPKIRLFGGDYFISTWLADADSRLLLHNLDKVIYFTVNMDTLRPSIYPRKADDCIYFEDYSFE